MGAGRHGAIRPFPPYEDCALQNDGRTMKFTEAFAALGYVVAVPRQDWSADRPNGVCITIWASELGSKGGLPWIDTRIHAKDNALWRDKPGNGKRIRHLGRA